MQRSQQQYTHHSVKVTFFLQHTP